MKTTKLLFLLTLIFIGLTFSSCSSDDNDATNFNPKNVFNGPLPKEIGDYTYKYNSDGFLEEASEPESNLKITFEYPSRTKSTGSISTVIMKYYNLIYPKYNFVVKFTIGSNGFASSALQTFTDNSTDTWEFRYNSDGQLNYMKWNYNDNEEVVTTTITYANGNITGVKKESDDKTKSIRSTSIDYISENQPNGIDNKGCIMLFRKTIGVDMYDMNIAYYAGLLGRGTKKLPLKSVFTYSNFGRPFKYIDEYFWSLDTNGLPTELRVKEDDPFVDKDKDIYLSETFCW